MVPLDCPRPAAPYPASVEAMRLRLLPSADRELCHSAARVGTPGMPSRTAAPASCTGCYRLGSCQPAPLVPAGLPGAKR